MRHGHDTNRRGIVIRGVVACGAVLGLLAVIACGPGAAPSPTSTATTAPKLLATATPTATVVAPPTPTPGPKRGGILNKFNATDTGKGSMDPNIENSSRDVYIVSPIFSGLIRYDPLNSNVIVPDLAKSWTISSDGKSYVFKLRTDAKFHDGTPVTPEDVVYSLRRLVGEVDSKVASSRVAPSLKPLWGGVEITGANEVTVRSTEASALFLGQLASGLVKIVPKHVLEASGNKVTDKPIGSGPFKLAKWQRDVVVEYERHPGYVTSYAEGGNLPYLDGVRTYIIKDASAQVAAFQADQVSVWPRFPALTPSQSKALQNSLGDKVVVAQYPDAGLLLQRLNSTTPAFKDPRVVKAMWVAMDRKSLNAVIFDGTIVPGVILDPDVFPGAALPLSEVYSYPGVKEPDYALAKKLLADAGYPNGIDIEFVTRKVNWYEDAADVLIQGLAKAGIRVKHTVLDSTAGGQRHDAGLFDVNPIATRGFNSPQPLEGLLGPWATNGAGNDGKWSDPELDKLLKQAETTLDPAQHNEAVRKVQRYIYSNMSHGTIPAGVQKVVLAHMKYVKGYVPGKTLFESAMFDTAWLDR